MKLCSEREPRVMGCVDSVFVSCNLRISLSQGCRFHVLRDVSETLRVAGSRCDRLGNCTYSSDPRIRIIPLLGIKRCPLVPGFCNGISK